MKISSTPDRLKEIIKLYDLRQTDVIERAKLITKEIGVTLSNSDLSQYVNGKTLPSQEKLTLLARTLGVSEPWLMGYDVPMYPQENKKREEVKEEKVNLEYKDNGDLVITVKATDSKINILLNKLNALGKEEALKRIEELSFIPKFTE